MSEIVVTNDDGSKIAITLISDSGIKRWLEAFRTILYWQTFVEETIEEFIPSDISMDEEPF